MLLPTLAFVTVFSYIPLSGWIIAFTDYRLGSNIFNNKFVGFKEFKYFFTGVNDAGYVIVNTIAMNLMATFCCIVAACVFAIMLAEVRNRSIKRSIQTLSFFPFFVSWVITYNVFNSFLAVDSGVINNLLKLMGMKSGINFMGNPAYSWGLMIFVNIWKYIGYDSVIFLAAIAGIDQEQYEAAGIDGAGRMAKIIYITLPALIPTIVMILVLNSGWIFRANFEQFFLFYNRSNWSKMEVLDIYIYRYGLRQLDFSYATAVGIIQTFASLIMVFTVNYVAKKLRGQSIM